MYGMTIFTRRGPQAWLVAAISSLVVFRGLTSRVMVWNDELINTYKASAPVIIDYAVRPVFYSINHLAFRFFGERYESLVLAAALATIACALLVHRIAWMLVESPLALLAPLLYLSHFWTLTHGVHAMPHIHAACFGVFSLWCLLHVFRSSVPGPLACSGAGIGMALALLSHHTGIVYVALDCGLLAVCLLRALWKRGARWKARVIRMSGILAIAAATILGTEAAYSSNGQSYFGYWKAAMLKVGANPTYERYWQPFWYYFARLHQEYAWTMWFLALALAGCLGYAVARRRTPHLAAPGMRGSGGHALLVLYGLASLTAISFIRWKFPRVVVGFGPVVSLALFSMFCIAVESARASAGARASRLLSTGLALVLAILCARSGCEAIRGVDTQSRKSFWKYSSLYEIAQSLQPGAVYGYIGTGPGRVQTVRFFGPGGNEVVPLGTAEEILAGERAHIIEQLTERGIDHVVLARQTVGAAMPAFRRALLDSHLVPVYDWRGILEVWKFCPFRDSSYDAVACLHRLKPGTRVGIVRNHAESFQRMLVKACGLQPVRLQPAADLDRFVGAVRKRRLESFVLPVLLPGEPENSVARLGGLLRGVEGERASLMAASRVSAISQRRVEVWRIRDAAE